MALAPQKFRERVLQVLYGLSQKENEWEEAMEEELLQEALSEELELTPESWPAVFAKASAVAELYEKLDLEIAAHCPGYRIERIHSMERAILRLALYELLIEKTVPPKVAIAEALRLCNKFSTPEAIPFVNGILDAIYRRSEESNRAGGE